jgi:deoxyadenosine/deoxycytidine kinase
MAKVEVFITIEGNIGAGKSTLLRVLRSKLESKIAEMNDDRRVARQGAAATAALLVQEEPVDTWVRDGLLQKFYADPKRFAFAFQMMVMENRIAAEADTYAAADASAARSVVVLQERSRESDRIFARTQAEDGNIDPDQLRVYERGFDLWQRLLPNRTTCTAYLRTRPKACLANVQKRARDSEGGGVSLDYLRRLHAAHENEMEETWRDASGGGGGARETLVVDYENGALEATCDALAARACRLLSSGHERAGNAEEATRWARAGERIGRSCQ